MSPSRRRAIGAVRGLASRAALPVAARHRGAWLGIPRPPPVPRCRAHRPCGMAVGRDVLIAPPRLIARGGSPPRCVAWQVAHAESFTCRGSVRGTVRGRAAHPARYPYRAAITPAIFARPRGDTHYPRAIARSGLASRALARGLPAAARHPARRCGRAYGTSVSRPQPERSDELRCDPLHISWRTREPPTGASSIARSKRIVSFAFGSYSMSAQGTATSMT